MPRSTLSRRPCCPPLLLRTVPLPGRLTGLSRTTPFSVWMMRDSHSSMWMPRGWANRRATSKGRLNLGGATGGRFPHRRRSSPSSARRRIKVCAVSGALQGPEEQGGHPGVLFQGTGRSVSGLGFRCAQNLFQCFPSDYLPDPFQVFGEFDRARPSGVSTAEYRL